MKNYCKEKVSLVANKNSVMRGNSFKCCSLFCVCYKNQFLELQKKSYLIILLQSDIVTSHCDLIVRDFVNVHIQWGTFHPWTTCRIGPILVGNYATWWRHINRGTSATQFQKKSHLIKSATISEYHSVWKSLQNVSFNNFASEASSSKKLNFRAND